MSVCVRVQHMCSGYVRVVSILLYICLQGRINVCVFHMCVDTCVYACMCTLCTFLCMFVCIKHMYECVWESSSALLHLCVCARVPIWEQAYVSTARISTLHTKHSRYTHA